MLLLRRQQAHPFSSGGWEFVYSELPAQVGTTVCLLCMPCSAVQDTGCVPAVLPVPDSGRICLLLCHHQHRVPLRLALPALLPPPHAPNSPPSSPPPTHLKPLQHIGGGRLWLGVPSVIEHRVDAASAMHGMTEGDLAGTGGCLLGGFACGAACLLADGYLGSGGDGQGGKLPFCHVQSWPCLASLGDHCAASVALPAKCCICPPTQVFHFSLPCLQTWRSLCCWMESMRVPRGRSR
jgi:hypothetical protein